MSIENIVSSTVASSSRQLVANMKQEAMETTTVTRAEASKGDQQAIRKLAKINAQNAQTQAVATPEPASVSTSQVINVKA